MNILDMATLSPEAAMAFKAGLRAIHFVGLVLGLGAATLLDLVILRFLATREVSADHCRVVEFTAKVVSIGLTLLWVSGLGFLLHYGTFDPAKLGNQKIWAKIAIVGVLTLNGVFIHRSILPLVRRNIGRGLFEGLGAGQRALMLTAGAVSATSWYVPMLLGTFPQLDFVVSAWVILAAYSVLLTGAILVTQCIARMVLPRVATVTLSHAGHEDLPRRLGELDNAVNRAFAQTLGRCGGPEPRPARMAISPARPPVKDAAHPGGGRSFPLSAGGDR